MMFVFSYYVIRIQESESKDKQIHSLLDYAYCGVYSGVDKNKRNNAETMVKSKRSKKANAKRFHKLTMAFSKNKTLQKGLLLTGGVVALGALGYTIINMPILNPGSTPGVGADGYSVSEIKGADLGIADVAKKPLVEQELQAVAGRIGNVNKSGVINMNGNKGQTATYYFESKSDKSVKYSFYVDVMQYKSEAAYNSAAVFKGTGDAGMVAGLAARYLPAATIAGEREYALLVTKDLNSYKFAITQPAKKLTITEPTAQAIVKKIAEQADLK